jgi:hypothetical protein
MVETFWRRCSTCKRVIGFGVPYWICSVSTCNRKGSAFVFCSMPCWDGHLPTMRHREAWAEEQRSPSREDWGLQSAHAASKELPREETGDAPAAEAPIAAGLETAEAPAARGEIPREILIVASKLKNYIRARSGMNTSDTVMEILSTRVRSLCDDAILRAREDGRKTVMDRDF